MSKKLGLVGEEIFYSYDENEEQIIKGISMEIQEGKITALIGANGCGKSTLLQLFTGRLKPKKGKVSLDGEDVRKIKPREFAKKVGVVHQYNAAPDDITVGQLVEWGRTPYQKVFSYKKGKEDKEAVDKAMILTQIKEFENRRFQELSGGQKQRVWLAMALAQEPKVLLLDEITTYLDIRYQIELLTLIKELNKSEKLTVLMVLHDINQAMEYAHHIVVMKEGVILRKGASDQVITQSILKEAFGVNVEIVKINKRKHCLFKTCGKSEECLIKF